MLALLSFTSQNFYFGKMQTWAATGEREREGGQWRHTIVFAVHSVTAVATASLPRRHCHSCCDLHPLIPFLATPPLPRCSPPFFISHIHPTLLPRRGHACGAGKNWIGNPWERQSLGAKWGSELVSGFGPFEFIDMCAAAGIVPIMTTTAESGGSQPCCNASDMGDLIECVQWLRQPENHPP